MPGNFSFSNPSGQKVIELWSYLTCDNFWLVTLHKKLESALLCALKLNILLSTIK